MSKDEGAKHANSAERQPSAASEVHFTTASEIFAETKRPVSSRGESFRREKERWSRRGQRLREKLLTPPKALSHERSDEVKDDSESSGKHGNGARESTRESRSPSSSNTRERAAPDTVSNGDSKKQVAGSETSSFDIVDSPASVSLRSRQQRLSHAPSMDPAQLVQMALNLSESRRRHASNPLASSVLQRPTSSLFSDTAVASVGSNHAPYGISNANPLPASRYNESFNSEEEHYDISPSTLARVERARQYFELADKYRRLLAQLPPLPRSSHAGRMRALSRVSARARPSSEGLQLGREYNPLQALRNKRYRQQHDLGLSVRQFEDTDKVEHWVSEIERISTERKTLACSAPVSLPTYEASAETERHPKGHKRAGTADSIVTRSEHEWTVTPAELLADTYWTEQGHNAALSEANSKHGDAVNRHRAPTLVSGDIREQQVKPSSTEDVMDDKVRHSHRHLLPLSAANRIRSRGFARHRSASVSSASSTEGHKLHSDDLNVGPLQRHMDLMIQRDAEENVSTGVNSPDRWEPMHSNRKSVGHHHRLTRSPRMLARHKAQALAPLDEANGHVEARKAVVSSPDSSYPTSPVTDKMQARLDRQGSLEPHHEHEAEYNADDLHARPVPTVELTDRLAVSESKQVDSTDAIRSSTESTRPTNARHKTADSITSIKDIIHTRSKTESSETSREPGSAVSRFLRGGRDMVRHESMKFGNKIRGRDRRETDISAANSDISDAEGGKPLQERFMASAEQSDVSPRPSLEKQRSRYHVPLPSFKSPQARDNMLLAPNDASDHISRQSHLRKRDRSPRFERLAPPRISLPSEEVESPFSDLPTDRSSFHDDRRKSYGFLNPTSRSRSRSHSKGPTWLGRARQSNTTSLLPTVPTTTVPEGRHWSISDSQPTDLFGVKSSSVSSRDIARVKALLLASGIKARELTRRLESPSSKTPAFLLDAAELAMIHKSAIEQRAAKVEALYAFDILSSLVEDIFRSMGREVETFQTKDLQALITRQEKLKARVTEDLTELVHGAADQADSFNIEVSTQATLRTKSVDDVIDAVLRLRRRQFRLLRRAAFKMLEWFTLSILWLVWFVVVCIKTAQRIVVGVFRLIRWLIVF